jgi:transposase
MTHLSADAKHRILLEYRPRTPGYTFQALADRHGIAGGRWVIERWYHQWNGTAQSLEEKPHPGRPRLLSSAEVNQYIRTPIRTANRRHESIHYTDIHDTLIINTDKNISLRAVQYYGKREINAKQKRTRKRSAQESNTIFILILINSSSFVFYTHSLY